MGPHLTNKQTPNPPNQSDISKLESSRNDSFTKSFRPASTPPRQPVDTKPLPEAPDLRNSIHAALSKPHNNSLRQSTPNIQGTAQATNHNGHRRQARSPPQAGIITRPQSVSGPPGRPVSPPTKPKAVAWEITIPEKLPDPGATDHRPSSAPSERHHIRSRSHGQVDSGKSTTLKSILESFLQSERRKPLASCSRPDDPPRKLSNQRSSSKLKMPFPVFGQTGDSRPRRQSVSVSDARQSALNLFRARSADDLRNFKNLGPSNRSTPRASPSIPKSERQFMWSDSQTNVSSTYILKPSSGSSSPRLPQPVPPYCRSTKESLAEVDEDKTDAESIITALPSIGSLSPKTVEERAFGKATGNSPEPLPTIQSEAIVSPPRHSSRNASQHVNSKRAASSNSAGQRSGATAPRSTSSRHTRKSSLPLRGPHPKATAPPSPAPDGSSPLVRPRNRKNGSLRIRVTEPTKPKYGSTLAPGHGSASLVEYLASTPPASPIHDRNPSTSSGKLKYPATANKLSQSHSSRSRLGLGVKIGFNVDPDMSSPPPPGPGGPIMVTPDYGAQSAFEGEKVTKAKRTISVGQILASPEKSLRRFFGSFVGGDSPRNGAAASSSSGGRRSQSISKERVHVVGQGVKRDMSCFHGVGKDGTWVSDDRSS